MKSSLHATCALMVLLLFEPRLAQARDLSFEDRVKAQEAIERVYYSHQIGATKPFQEAVPRSLVEVKTRTYLKQSMALDGLWSTPIAPEMLRQEMERIAQATRMPERLEELYAALGNDSLLIQECLVRPVLADRMAREFFASDSAIQKEARSAAERLHARLRDGRLDPLAEHPDRTVLTLVRGAPLIQGEASRDFHPRGQSNGLHRELPPEDFDRLSAAFAGQVGDPGPLVETPDRFLIRLVLERRPEVLRLAVYTVEKRKWDDWWREIETRFDERSLTAVAASDTLVPSTLGPTCNSFDTWTPIPVTANSPTPREHHTAVWTGTLMIVWGGIQWIGDTYYLLNSGGRYDPVLDTWTPTSIASVPTARWYQAGVWTGERMVVWGGEEVPRLDSTNTGGRYDPITDTWSPTLTLGAPTARWGATAVWTGSRVVVWGGDPISYPLNGGRYDPVTDTWAPTSLVNGPAIRFYHTAVWTGDRMVVWGGESDQPFENTGGRYDPVTDTWSPTSMLGAPTARYSHSAVWTGGLMIVWGGLSSVGYESSGGLYDPSADSWTATTTANAPSGRYNHTAAWTGNRMVVWGGGIGNSFAGATFNTGGRYNPVSDSWQSTSTTSAPAARWNQSTVAAGDLMLVWGGSVVVSGHSVADGGAYCSCAVGTFFQDADGDGHGDPGVSIQACNQPPGFVADGTDCNDADSFVWLAPTEVTDLLVGAANPTDLVWNDQSTSAGPETTYDLVWGGLTDPGTIDYASAVCLQSGVASSYKDARSDPGVGTAYWFLARALNSCGVGTYGTSQQDTSLPACP